MFTIKNKAKSPKMIWDAKNKKPLLVFKGGVFETEDEAIANKAKALGYEVTGAAKKASKGNKKGSAEKLDEKPDDSEKGAE